MKRVFALLIVAAFALPAAAQPAPNITLTRLDCGTSIPPGDMGRFSDTFGHQGLALEIVYSCYLVKHGADYLLWDTGHSMKAGERAPKASVPDQLAQLNLKPEQIKYIGISHYHRDHIGQAVSFPHATLLIGKGDWEVITAPTPSPSTEPAAFTPWTSGGSKVEPVALDKDIFGDGSVVMLYTPGHTPGHHSLLVKLKEMGNVIITGDLAHFRENYDSGGVPPFNTDRAQTLASLERFKKIAANLKATVVIQHDARDIAKLPAFPASAR